MNTTLLMTLSAVFYAALGVVATFLPQELLAHAGGRPQGTSVLLVQMLGALYLALAMLNWIQRASRLGGIYGRPVTMANFVNFTVGGVALVKAAFAQQFPVDVTVMAAIYSILGIWFGLVLFTPPALEAPQVALRHRQEDP
jgi:hypothetical protein